MVVKKDEVVVEDEVLEVETQADEEEAVEPEIDQAEDEAESVEDDDEDRIVTIGDPVPEEVEGEEEKPETPEWVKKVRKANRSLEKENKRLKKELEARSTAVKKPPEVGPEPTLKSCGYDEGKFRQEVAAYESRKREVAAFEERQKKSAEEQQKRWESQTTRYVERKAAHGFKDFTDAEEVVTNTLDVTQQGIIVQGAEDSALVVYALGKNQKKLDELSKLTDPVEFAVAIGKLEAQLKVTKKETPKPERRVTAPSSGLGGNSDKVLEKLRTEAEKTGDYTAVRKYKASKNKE